MVVTLSHHKGEPSHIEDINGQKKCTFYTPFQSCNSKTLCPISTQQQKLALTRQQRGSQIESSWHHQTDEKKREK